MSRPRRGSRVQRRPRTLPARRVTAGWARQPPVRALRRLLHAGVVRPLLAAELRLDIGGSEEIAAVEGPVVLVANHGSHLDTPVLLAALPAERRRRTGVAVTGDYFFDSGWRAVTSAVAFNTFAQTLPGDGPSRTPGALLEEGWSVLIFPEGSRSSDGFVGEFGDDAAGLAIEHRVPVVPVGIRGSFAAMPRGSSWPGPRRSRTVPGLGIGSLGLSSLDRRRERPRVSIRFGSPLWAEDASGAGAESVPDFTARIRSAVRQLIAEDVTTWWQSRRDPRPDDTAEPPPGSWRRVWEQNLPTEAGGRVKRPKIWR